MLSNEGLGIKSCLHNHYGMDGINSNMWIIWREHNGRIFDDQEHLVDQLIALFTGTLFDWSRSWGFTSSDFIPLFLASLLICT